MSKLNEKKEELNDVHVGEDTVHVELWDELDQSVVVLTLQVGWVDQKELDLLCRGVDEHHLEHSVVVRQLCDDIGEDWNGTETGLRGIKNGVDNITDFIGVLVVERWQQGGDIRVVVLVLAFGHKGVQNVVQESVRHGQFHLVHHRSFLGIALDNHWETGDDVRNRNSPWGHAQPCPKSSYCSVCFGQYRCTSSWCSWYPLLRDSIDQLAQRRQRESEHDWSPTCSSTYLWTRRFQKGEWGWRVRTHTNSWLDTCRMEPHRSNGMFFLKSGTRGWMRTKAGYSDLQSHCLWNVSSNVLDDSHGADKVLLSLHGVDAVVVEIRNEILSDLTGVLQDELGGPLFITNRNGSYVIDIFLGYRIRQCLE